MLFNARSIKNRAKRFELSSLLSAEKFKLIDITETWGNETLSDSMLVTDVCTAKRFPYFVYRKDRKDGGEGGGVCFLI